MTYKLDISTMVRGHVDPQWARSIRTKILSLGQPYSPLVLARAGLNEYEPDCLGFALLETDIQLRRLVAEFKRGQDPDVWFDGHVQNVDGFKNPAVVVKIVKAIASVGEGGGGAVAQIGETVVCLFSPIPPLLAVRYERALHLQQIEVELPELDGFLTIPG